MGPLVDWDGATLHDVDVTVYSPACCKAFNIKDSYGNTVGLFDKLGNLYLKGQTEAGRAASANDEFIFGNDLVIIDASNGNMYMDGNVNEDQGSLQNPAGDDFIIKDDSVVVQRELDRVYAGISNGLSSYGPFSFGPHLLAKGQKKTCFVH